MWRFNLIYGNAITTKRHRRHHLAVQAFESFLSIPPKTWKLTGHKVHGFILVIVEDVLIAFVYITILHGEVFGKHERGVVEVPRLVESLLSCGEVFELMDVSLFEYLPKPSAGRGLQDTR